MIALGIDTSNYATSLAFWDGTEIKAHVKRFLPVPDGALGLRQSDAVFAHTKALPSCFSELVEQNEKLLEIDCIGVSEKPRSMEGSYMPCFLTGVSAATAASVVSGKKLHCFSHQEGHVMAALVGCGLFREQSLSFLAFHISGGTTDALTGSLSGPSLNVSGEASSLDLFAGQAVDRVGSMLGLPFPSGEALSMLAEQSDSQKFMKPVIKDNGNCCLSGLQNKCEKLIKDGAAPQDVARYCLLSVAETIAAMTRFQMERRSYDAVLFAGGVMSSSVIRPYLLERFPNALFPEPAWLSSDNAVGVAALALRKEEMS